MKITIDTKEDSEEEIKKAINLLSSLIGAVESSTLSSDPEPVVGEGIFGMFQDKKETHASEDSSEVEGMINETKEEDVVVPDKKVEDTPPTDDDDAKIVPY